ncbi:MAG TPA: DUF1080 domain-containing protein [Verrucomicrobiae bacterium]|nr:DUF1080 domain-containing protein [Verrucomicrobiae bacterium]
MKLWKNFAATVVLPLLLVTVATAQDSDTDYPPPHARENSVTLFNGKDFSGFTFCMKDNADPLQTWSVPNGVIHCTGKPIGYLRTTEVYSNYFLTVEWRFVKVAPKADNTGVLVHIQSPDKVWPMCVQVQGKHTRQGDLFVMAGAECKEHKGQDANTPVPFRKEFIEQPAELPIGEWNRSETICLHGKVSTFLNGKFVNEITECTVNSGYIGIQSEGGDIEIRSMNLAPLKY